MSAATRTGRHDPHPAEVRAQLRQLAPGGDPSRQRRRGEGAPAGSVARALVAESCDRLNIEEQITDETVLRKVALIAQQYPSHSPKSARQSEHAGSGAARPPSQETPLSSTQAAPPAHEDPPPPRVGRGGSSAPQPT